MRIILIFSFLILAVPVHALCSINAEDSVCVLPNFNTNNTHLFQNTNIETNLNNKQTPLQPFQQGDLFNKTPTPNNKLMKYDSGCQFGICVQDLKQNLPNNN